MPSRDEIQAFSTLITELTTSKSLSYIEAVIHHCGETGVELELANKLLSEGLKAKIRVEAERLHFIKSSGPRLPMKKEVKSK